MLLVYHLLSISPSMKEVMDEALEWSTGRSNGWSTGGGNGWSTGTGNGWSSGTVNGWSTGRGNGWIILSSLYKEK